MYVQERDAYYEAYRGAPGYVLWGLWFVWVLVTVIGYLVSQGVGQSVQASVFPPEASSFRLLSLDGNFISGGAVQYVSALAGGIVAGIVFGIAQGLFLLPFLKLVGMLEWVAATTVGLAVRWVAMYAISRELVGLTLDQHIVGVCVLFWLMIGIGSIAGVTLGYAQSVVLRRRAWHSEWWVWANIAGPVVTALAIGMGLYVETQNTLRDATTLIIAVISALVTGIALLDLLRHPSEQAEWLSRLRWRQPPPEPAPDDTVLGSTLYAPRQSAPFGQDDDRHTR